jgi:predicted dehydrogenase
MTRVKVIGAGSIGNHLSNASRRMGWDVDICDLDPAALERTRNDIYPTRYGAWDEGIGLYHTDDVPRGGYDYIFVGTPPDSHMKLALEALGEQPRAILVEKPLCTPSLEGAAAFHALARENGVAAFCGYDHAVSQGMAATCSETSLGAVGEAMTLDVEFREHWQGIFNAHPWLDGPASTYLGYWQRGGGAAGEHSHALNLWQRIALALGKGRVSTVSAAMEYARDGEAEFDRLCLANLTTETGFNGRVVQDVVTRPSRKWARIQGSEGFVEWQYAYRPGEEAVFIGDTGGVIDEKIITKTRADDFVEELRHLDAAVNNGAAADSPIALERALETMMVIAAAHKSAQAGRSIEIDYDAGYVEQALS